LYTSDKKNPDAIEAAAAEWLARRDRGLIAKEQDAYLQWLRETPLHGAALARLENSWAALDRLEKWRPVHSLQPNPDLLAPQRQSIWRWVAPLAAAAAVVVGAILWFPRPVEPSTPRQAIIHFNSEKISLEDGSIAELNNGAKIKTDFTESERRVTLMCGEAHFTVAKNAKRPFIVSADKFFVRAVGTAFSVTMNRDAVSVLVTEGRVRLEDASGVVDGQIINSRELSHLHAGQQGVVSTITATEVPVVQVREVTTTEIQRSLSWQGMRLQFVDMPLADVVAEFNRYNLRQLVIGDVHTGAILVGGNFRADNVDAFVHLLSLSFGLSATPRGDQIVLRLAP
jgi:transmembrane sensor